MIPYQIYQNKSRMVAKNYKHWYARAVSTETIDLKALAAHMADHHTPFSQGAILGILTDMVHCVKELLLEGKNIKIDDLAVFSTTIENVTGGSLTAEEFNVAKHVKSIRMSALATGILRKAILTQAANLQERGSYASPKASAATASAAPSTGDDHSGGESV